MNDFDTKFWEDINEKHIVEVIKEKGVVYMANLF